MNRISFLKLILITVAILTVTVSSYASWRVWQDMKEIPTRTTETTGIKKELKNDAKKQAQNTEHSSWTDDIGDVSQAHIDLFIGSLFAENLTSDLKIAINVTGLFPDTNVNSKFEMLFNTDNNLGTGGIFDSFRGIDKVLKISLIGQFPFTVPEGSITAELLDVVSGTLTPLTPGSVERIHKIIETKDPSAPSSTFDYVDAIHQLLPLPHLRLSAHQVPIGVRATNIDTEEFDEVSFVFEVEGIAPTSVTP